MSSKSVIVIGGGLAGLSSAVALAEAGYRVRLLENRPHLGGRAASYVLPGGEHVDNCQHVTLGCCTNLEDFYRRVGASDKIRYYDRLLFSDASGKRGAMQSSAAWPAPLHLAASFARFPFLGWSDKRAIAAALLAIARSGGRPADAAANGSGTMLEWLQAHRQTERAIRRFWEVILVSALDENLDRIAAGYGIDVFWKAFLSTRAGYRLGIPCVPLGQLYDGCRDAIVRKGGEVVTRARVRGFTMAGGAMCGVEIENGQAESADYYISAVPQDVLPGLLPADVVAREQAFSNLKNIRTSPITGVHLWFDRVVMGEPFLSLLDTTTQWVFNKRQLYNDPPETGGQYLQLVISAAYKLVACSRQEIIDICLSELKAVLPAVREAKLIKGTVIKEVNATFSPEPGSDQWRPPQKTSIGNFFLAGDWTATGWPSTMEGAVRSGYLAAEAVLLHAGVPQNILQPDLPPEGLSRIWFRRMAARNSSEVRTCG